MGLSGLQSLRNNFMCKLQELLGDRFEHFESLDSFEKASFVLGIVTLALCLILLRIT